MQGRSSCKSLLRVLPLGLGQKVKESRWLPCPGVSVLAPLTLGYCTWGELFPTESG